MKHTALHGKEMSENSSTDGSWTTTRAFDKTTEMKMAVAKYHSELKIHQMMFESAKNRLWDDLQKKFIEIEEYEPPKRDCF